MGEGEEVHAAFRRVRDRNVNGSKKSSRIPDEMSGCSFNG